MAKIFSLLTLLILISGVGIGLVVVSVGGGIHAEMGTGRDAARSAGKGVPAAAQAGGRRFRYQDVRRTGHGDHRHARGMPAQVPAL